MAKCKTDFKLLKTHALTLSTNAQDVPAEITAIAAAAARDNRTRMDTSLLAIIK
jgi:hypothetical protein